MFMGSAKIKKLFLNILNMFIYYIKFEWVYLFFLFLRKFVLISKYDELKIKLNDNEQKEKKRIWLIHIFDCHKTVYL